MPSEQNSGKPNHPAAALPLTLTPDAQAPGRSSSEWHLSFTSRIVHMVMGEKNLPAEVKVEGEVLDAAGVQVGTFEGAFMQGAVFLPLPDALSRNRFGIPAGTVMPSWAGPVDYHLQWGTLRTAELAWIFPSDMANPQSPLAVLSVSDITGGTQKFESAAGTVVTPDGYDNHGSLQITLSLPHTP